MATPTLYHGTNAVLQPGDEIHSAAFMQGAGVDVSTHLDADYYSSDQIYLTTEPHLAERYAVGTAGRHGGEPHVYEVRPIGYSGQDPEYLESGFGSDQHVATMGEVVREIPLPGTVHWDPDTNSMMRGASKIARFYHRTDADLQPGDVIQSAAERGMPNNKRWSDSTHYDPELVYFYEGLKAVLPSPWKDMAHEYEVEPIGEMEPDPEGGPNSGLWVAPSARVVRRVSKLASSGGALDDEPRHDVGAGELVSDRDLVKLYVHGYTDIYSKLEGAIADLIDREGVITPTLYRGDRPGKNQLVESWTTDRSIAEHFASERDGSVVELPAGAARGVSTNAALGPDAYVLEDFGNEDEWLLKDTAQVAARTGAVIPGWSFAKVAVSIGNEEHAGRDRWIRALEDGEQVGRLEYHQRGNTIKIRNVWVDQSHRRQGIATKLLDRLRDLYPDHDIDPGDFTAMGERWWQSLGAKLAADTVTLYHGTTAAAAEKILQEGLKPTDIDATVADIGERYGISPDTIMNHPWGESLRWRQGDQNTYLTSDRSIAESYARNASEPVNDALRTVYRIQHEPDDNDPQYHSRATQWAKDEAAKHYEPAVLEVDVPRSAVENDALWEALEQGNLPNANLSLPVDTLGGAQIRRIATTKEAWGSERWHLTDDPHFQPDPSYKPDLNSLFGDMIPEADRKAGIFVGDPEYWMHAHGYYRPYVAEIAGGTVESSGQYGDFVSGPGMHTVRVLTLDEYARETYNEPGWVESSEGKEWEHFQSPYRARTTDEMSSSELSDWESRFRQFQSRQASKKVASKRYYRGIVVTLEKEHSGDAELGRALLNGTATGEQVVKQVSAQGIGIWFGTGDMTIADEYAAPIEELCWDEEYGVGEIGIIFGIEVDQSIIDNLGPDPGYFPMEMIELEYGDPVTVVEVYVRVVREEGDAWNQEQLPMSPMRVTADKVDDATELLPGGGFTLSLHGNVPRWGWMVSLGGTEEKFDFPPSRAELQGYIDKWAAELAPPSRYWGGERRGGTVNIDVSECIDDRDEAMAYGREQGQERIYNLGSGRYIALTGAKGQVTTRFYIHTDTPVDEVESFIKSLSEDEIVERNESLFAVGVPPQGSDLVREFAVTPAGDDFFAGEADDISRSYRDLAVNDPNVDPLWKELGELCRAQADALRVTMDIQVVTDHDPYANAAQMHADMDKGIYQVTTLHSDHPVWDVDTNVAFRIAHDVLGHGVAHSDFSFRGEVEAYQAQCGVIPRRLWPVLFTEVIAQSAYANTHHLFGEQKVGLIPLTQEEINAQVGKVMDAPDPAYDAMHRSASKGDVYDPYFEFYVTDDLESIRGRGRDRETFEEAKAAALMNLEEMRPEHQGAAFVRKQLSDARWTKVSKLSLLHLEGEADHAGSMVALVPPESIRDALHQDDGEPVENMHVTIVYIGKEKFEEAQAALEEYIITAPQLEGRVGGFGIFEASETSDNKQVLVALMDIPHLDEWRVGLLGVLKTHGVEPPDNHGFTPHCTLAYTDDPKIPDMPEGAKGDFVIDRILFSAGDEDTFYPLNFGAMPRTSAAIPGWPLARVAGTYTFDVDYVKDLDQLKDGVIADGTHRVTVEAETWPEAEMLAAQIVGSTQGVPTATRRVV